MKQPFVFVMDALESIHILRDTSFALMLAAQDLGYPVIHVLAGRGLSLRGDVLRIHGRKVEVFPVEGAHFRVLSEEMIDASSCKAIWIRTDPPFNEAYLNTTWLLSFAERVGVRVINSPRGIREANEKLYALRFPSLCPPTLVTHEISDINEWMLQHGPHAIAKPIDGHGGFGVVRLNQGDVNFRAIIDMLTDEGKKPVLVQQWVSSTQPGDRRLLVIDGELCGVVRRVAPKDDHRGNVHIGGHVEPDQITDRDREIVSQLRDSLRSDGLWFVGLDVIEGHLIEVNVTSPTLIQELKRLGGPDLACEMISRLIRS